MNTSNKDIATLAVFFSGGILKTVDIEVIADTAFKLSPARFCWKLYADRIDLRTVQYALKDALSINNPKIKGSLRSGFQMTDVGLTWAKEQENDGKNFTGEKMGSIDQQIEVERNRLRNTEAYKKIIHGHIDGLIRRDFESFVRINEYFPLKLKKTRFHKMDVIISGEEDLVKVWKILTEKVEGEGFGK
jgi:hypothetical protein